MGKAELQAYLDKQKDRYMNIYGGEVVRYAANPTLDKIKGSKPIGLPHGNEREASYKEFLEQLEAGTYCPPEEPAYVPKKLRGRRPQGQLSRTTKVDPHRAALEALFG